MDLATVDSPLKHLFVGLQFAQLLVRMDELSLEIVPLILVVAFLEESREVDDVSLLIGYVDDVMCHLLMCHLSLVIICCT